MTLLGKLAAHDVKHMCVARSVWANVAMNQQKFQFSVLVGTGEYYASGTL